MCNKVVELLWISVELALTVTEEANGDVWYNGLFYLTVFLSL